MMEGKREKEQNCQDRSTQNKKYIYKLVSTMCIYIYVSIMMKVLWKRSCRTKLQMWAIDDPEPLLCDGHGAVISH